MPMNTVYFDGELSENEKEKIRRKIKKAIEMAESEDDLIEQGIII
jgi:CRISPR/Cas system-associated endoribonuclease Cas2